MISLAISRLGILRETVWLRLPLVQIAWAPLPLRRNLYPFNQLQYFYDLVIVAIHVALGIDRSWRSLALALG